MKSLIALRVDSNPTIGLGHLKRILSIAQILKKLQLEHHILCYKDSVFNILNNKVSSSIIKVVKPDEKISKEYTHCIADICYAGNNKNVNQLLINCSKNSIKTCIIDSMPPDHFDFSNHLQNSMPDLVVTPYHKANILRDKPRTKKWLAGAEFSVLSSEYLKYRKDCFDSKTKSILVSCGGSDPTKLSLKIADTLKNTNTPTRIVLGSLFSKKLKRELEQTISDNKLIKLLSPQNSLAKEIFNSSHVIGRVGLIRYETAFLGKRGVFLSEGIEYMNYLENLNADCVCEIYFSEKENGESSFYKRIKEITKNSEPPEINRRAMSILDGNGANRIIKEFNLI